MINLLYDNLDTYNLPNVHGMAEYDNTREYLKNFAYPYTCTLTQDAQKDRTYFYSVCPEQFLDCMSLDPNQVPDQKTIVTELTDELLELLKNEEYNVFLLIFFPYEGFSLEYGKCTVLKFLNHLVEVLEIPKEKILFIYGDLKIKDNIKNYFCQCSIPEDNLLGLDLFEHIAERDSRNTDFYHPTTTINTPKSKRFFSLNASGRSHRIYTIGALQAKGLLDQFYYSWLNSGDVTYTLDNLMSLFKYFSVDENYKQYIEGYAYIHNSAPIMLDATPEQIRDRKNQVRIIKDLYTDSYCSLVTETQVDEYEHNMMFISEKTYKAIYNYHPFLLVGCRGTLTYLRDKGYETFSDLFDETYDDYLSPAKRINAVLEQVDKFCKRDQKEIDDIYFSDYFTDKLIHNWKNFLKRKGQADFNIFVSWLSEFIK